MPEMTQFKDKIPAAGGKVEFLHDTATGRLASRISGTGFRAMYLVAVSLDGRQLLDTVPAMGIGQTAIYRQPSLITYIQSDQQGMWGRNCPTCEKYFRTNHVMDFTFCPYCSEMAPSLAFITKDQREYITAYYDAFARAYTTRNDTSLEMSEITDETSAWHYSEEKQQFHFKCETKKCQTETDVLGRYGFCPRCGTTNSRTLFPEIIDKLLTRIQETKSSVPDRHQREPTWEQITISVLSEFEALAKHLRRRLLRFPMTPNRRKELETLNFQKPLLANECLVEWFDIGLLDWRGDDSAPPNAISSSEIPFIRKMIQRRHILIHNGGLVDQEYLDLSGDTGVRLDERITIRSRETKRFLENIEAMGKNFLNNVEHGFGES
ncbi:MAG TPA: hypothetical protein VFQ00_09915 [Terriglobales bacterium]|nr:hypothetical protein [Terriglobales bacterium]